MKVSAYQSGKRVQWCLCLSASSAALSACAYTCMGTVLSCNMFVSSYSIQVFFSTSWMMTCICTSVFPILLVPMSGADDYWWGTWDAWLHPCCLHMSAFIQVQYLLGHTILCFFKGCVYYMGVLVHVTCTCIYTFQRHSCGCVCEQVMLFHILHGACRRRGFFGYVFSWNCWEKFRST